MNRSRVRTGLAAAGALLACAGCGYKGPLYLPERNATVVTHPVESAPAPASNQTQAPATKQKGKTPPASAPPPPSAPQ